jgi:hypothetical protein
MPAVVAAHRQRLKMKIVGHEEASRIRKGDLMVITNAGCGDTNFEGCDMLFLQHRLLRHFSSIWQIRGMILFNGEQGLFSQGC